MKLEHIIKTKPPFDKRNADPHKNYGIGSMLVWFIVKGDKGAIQFQLNTGGYLKHVISEAARKNELCFSDGLPMQGIIEGWDLGYHSHFPMYEGQSTISNDCNIINGKCYYDGTSLGAEEPLNIYIKEGEEGLWDFLEKVYVERFEEANP